MAAFRAFRLPAPRMGCGVSPRRFCRVLFFVVSFLGVLCGIGWFYLRNECLLSGYPDVLSGSCFKKVNYQTDELEQYVRAEGSGPNPPPKVHVVVATTYAGDVIKKGSWITEERIAQLLGLPRDNVQVLKYVSGARGLDKVHQPKYRPRHDKGGDAASYLTYVRDNYANLPDIALFLHPDEHAWQTDPMLLGSQSYALSRLNLSQVMQRGFVNLRASWRGGCPAYIDTEHPAKLEDGIVGQAWLNNFLATGAAHKKAPAIISAPRGSQFAVTREAMRKHRMSQLDRSLKWFETTTLNSAQAAHAWEYLFHYLFTQKAVDCPLERKVYCSLYNICLNKDEFKDYSEAEDESVELRKGATVLNVLWKSLWVWDYKHKLASLGDKMKQLRKVGLEQGKDPAVVALVGDLYTE